MIQRTFFCAPAMPGSSCREDSAMLRYWLTDDKPASAARVLGAPGLCLRRAHGGLVGDGLVADHLDERAQGFLHALAGYSRQQKRRLLGGALQPILLLLHLVRRH